MKINYWFILNDLYSQLAIIEVDRVASLGISISSKSFTYGVGVVEFSICIEEYLHLALMYWCGIFWFYNYNIVCIMRRVNLDILKMINNVKYVVR